VKTGKMNRSDKRQEEGEMTFLRSVDIFALLHFKRNIETWDQLRACNVNMDVSRILPGGRGRAYLAYFLLSFIFFYLGGRCIIFPLPPPMNLND
jgi:hypothetical protein